MRRMLCHVLHMKKKIRKGRGASAAAAPVARHSRARLVPWCCRAGDRARAHDLAPRIAVDLLRAQLSYKKGILNLLTSRRRFFQSRQLRLFVLLLQLTSWELTWETFSPTSRRKLLTERFLSTSSSETGQSVFMSTRACVSLLLIYPPDRPPVTRWRHRPSLFAFSQHCASRRVLCCDSRW